MCSYLFLVLNDRLSSTLDVSGVAASIFLSLFLGCADGVNAAAAEEEEQVQGGGVSTGDEVSSGGGTGVMGISTDGCDSCCDGCGD